MGPSALGLDGVSSVDTPRTSKTASRLLEGSAAASPLPLLANASCARSSANDTAGGGKSIAVYRAGSLSANQD